MPSSAGILPLEQAVERDPSVTSGPGKSAPRLTLFESRDFGPAGQAQFKKTTKRFFRSAVR